MGKKTNVKTTIVLVDNCDDSILGVLTVKGKTTKEINKIFHEVMEKLGDDWCLDDLLLELTDRKIKYNWDDTADVLEI